MSAEVVVTVKPNGQTTIEAEGWTGPTCSTITEPYRKALGQEITDFQKPEFWQETTTEHTNARSASS